MKQDLRWFPVMFFVALSLLVGCASSQPKELVERRDHSGLKVWYLTESATLRAKAEVMREMAAEYRKHQIRSPYLSELTRHCENLVERYAKAAEDAEALAKVHAQHPLSSSRNTQVPEDFKLFSF
jgi:hypothetical protein